MRVSIIGTGYVGLVTGVCMATLGHAVNCIDTNNDKISILNSGDTPIFEPGLKDLLKRAIEDKTIAFTANLKEGVKDAEAIFLALPTPPNSDGSADLSIILDAAERLGKCMPQNYCVVIDKSTVPVGTSDKVQSAIVKNTQSRFAVVSNPEFLREGFAIDDFLHPERIVIGCGSTDAEATMRRLYEPLIHNGTKLFVTTPATAELSKYAANTFLTTKINFMNEIAQLCELMDADVDSLRQIIGSDSRIGHKFLHPGIGAGGSCFPKDVRALKHMADQHDYDFHLIEATIAVNRRQHHVLVNKIRDHYNGKISGKTFGLWGLAFKPGTDDIRESPALHVVDELLGLGASIVGYDPEANANTLAKYSGVSAVKIVESKDEAIEASDALIIATEWQEFKDAAIPAIKRSMANPVVFDGRNIFTPDVMRKHNISYYSIGRRPVLA